MSWRRPAQHASSRIRAGIEAARQTPPAEKVYAMVTFVDSAGTGLFISASALIFVRLIGVSPQQAAVALTLAAGAGLLATLPAGALGDRAGYRRLLVVVHLLRGLIFPLYLVVNSYSWLLIVVVTIGVLDASEGPLRTAYLARVVPPGRRVTASAVNRVVYNIGLTLGAGAAALALAVPGRLGYQILVIGDSLSFLVAAALVSRISEIARVTQRLTQRGGPGLAVRNPAFVGASLLAGVLSVHSQLLTVGLPLWLVTRTDAPPPLVGVTLILNTVLAVLFQVRVGRNSNGIPGAARASYLGGGWLLAGCAVAAWTDHFSKIWAIVALLASVALLTGGELFVSVGSWGMSYALSPDDRLGEYQAVWRLGGQAVQVIGPAGVTYLLFTMGTTGWLLLGLIFLLAGGLLRPLARQANRRLDSIARPG